MWPSIRLSGDSFTTVVAFSSTMIIGKCLSVPEQVSIAWIGVRADRFNQGLVLERGHQWLCRSLLGRISGNLSIRNFEKGERSAGLRTFPLVAIASCGFIQATETLTAGNPEATARIVEGLITGMGFIGGGAILVVKASVRSTATAASLWATGAIGTSVGLGAYDVAIVLAIMTFLTLRLNATLKPDGPQNKAD